MARFENIQALFDLLWRTRDAQSMDALCGALSVSRATVRRLITLLRDQRGLDVRYDREQNGYRLHRGPKDGSAALLLGAEGGEVSALLEADVILQQIPPGLVRRVPLAAKQAVPRLRRPVADGAGPQRIHLHLSHLRRHDTQVFSAVLTALRSRKRLHLVYHSRSTDTAGSRQCSPLRLTFYRDNWYLAAWCHLRDALRVFSLDRVAKVKVMREPAFEPPAHRWVPDLESGYGIFAGRAQQVARLRFTPLAARWVADEQWHPQARRQVQPDGGLVLEVPYGHDTELVQEILRHGDQCQVVEPPALRRAVALQLRRAADQY